MEVEQLGRGNDLEQAVLLPSLKIDLPGTEGPGTVQQPPGLRIRTANGKVTVQVLTELESLTEHLSPGGPELGHDASHPLELIRVQSQLAGHALLVVPLDARHHLLSAFVRPLCDVPSRRLLRGRFPGLGKKASRKRGKRNQRKGQERGADGRAETAASGSRGEAHGSIPAASRASVSSETPSR